MKELIIDEHALKHGVKPEDIEYAWNNFKRYERAGSGKGPTMVKVMTSKEIEAKFGIPAEQLEQWSDDAEKGVYHGEPQGRVERGRPLLFGEETRQVGFKEPLRKIELIDLRAGQLGMKRSDYLRYLVDQDLELAGIA